MLNFRATNLSIMERVTIAPRTTLDATPEDTAPSTAATAVLMVASMAGGTTETEFVANRACGFRLTSSDWGF